MSIYPGQNVTDIFTTRNSSFQESNASPLTAALYVNGGVNGASVTIAPVSTGIYTFAVTMPSLSFMDRVTVLATGTVSGITDNWQIWRDTYDQLIPSDPWATVLPGSYAVNTAGYDLYQLYLRIPAGGGGSSGSTMTITSSAVPYITPTDLLNWRDWRQMADWITTTEGVGARGTQAAFLINPISEEHCNAAGGLLEAALVKGGRYTVADLQALQAAAPNQSWSMVKRILAWLAIDSMSRFKKGRTKDDDDEIEKALDLLNQLATGERILSFQQTQDAGVTDHTKWLSHHKEPSRQANRMLGDHRDRGRWW